MRKQELNDEQLEKLLRQMPKIIDHRDKNEIYQNIAIKMKKRKQIVWIMPSVATAAALLIFFILAPNLMSWQVSKESSMNDAAKRSSPVPEQFSNKSADVNEEPKQKTVERTDKANIEISSEKKSNDKISINSTAIEDSATALYVEDTNEDEVLTYSIPDKNAQVFVPISVVVPKEENQSKFDLFDKYMKNLNEEEWGLSDYFPLNATLDFDEETRVLTVDVPDDHTYGSGSASELPFKNVLTHAMMELNIEKINLTTEGKPGIEFGNSGVFSEFIPEEQLGNHAYYIYYPNEKKSKTFIIPYGEKVNSINEAFSAMRKNIQEEKLFASIPDNIRFKTEEDEVEKKLTIRFEEGSVINNDESTVHTIEAILLTAKEFSYQAVKFENAKIDKVGRFNLNDELQVPIAANKQTLLK